MLASKVKDLRFGAVAKASLKRATKYANVDPKLRDLCMDRVKRK